MSVSVPDKPARPGVQGFVRRQRAHPVRRRERCPSLDQWLHRHASTFYWGCLLIFVAMVSGCASTARPLLPDGTSRTPVNSAAAIRAYQDSLRDATGSGDTTLVTVAQARKQAPPVPGKSAMPAQRQADLALKNPTLARGWQVPARTYRVPALGAAGAHGPVQRDANARLGASHGGR